MSCCLTNITTAEKLFLVKDRVKALTFRSNSFILMSLPYQQVITLGRGSDLLEIKDKRCSRQQVALKYREPTNDIHLLAVIINGLIKIINSKPNSSWGLIRWF